MFQAFLPRQSLVTVYKTFIRPHIDYGNITGPIRVTSSEKNWVGKTLALRKRKYETFSAFKKNILKFIRQSSNSILFS